MISSLEDLNKMFALETDVHSILHKLMKLNKIKNNMVI